MAKFTENMVYVVNTDGHTILGKYLGEGVFQDLEDRLNFEHDHRDIIYPYWLQEKDMVILPDGSIGFVSGFKAYYSTPSKLTVKIENTNLSSTREALVERYDINSKVLLKMPFYE